MTLLLLLQFNVSRVEVPVVGRPNIASPFAFSQTRVDVPVIGRPTTNAGFARGWSFSAYRERLATETPPLLQASFGRSRTMPVTGATAQTPSVSTSTLLQSMVMLTPPAIPVAAPIAAPSVAPPAATALAPAAVAAPVLGGGGFGVKGGP